MVVKNIMRDGAADGLIAFEQHQYPPFKAPSMEKMVSMTIVTFI